MPWPSGSGLPGGRARCGWRRCLHVVELGAVVERLCRSDPGGLAEHRAARHVARRGVGDPVAARRAPGDQQIADPPWQQIAVGQLEVAAGGGQDQHPVTVDELGIDADGVVEASPDGERRARSCCRRRRPCGCRGSRASSRSCAVAHRSIRPCTDGARRWRASPGVCPRSRRGSGRRGRCRRSRPCGRRSCTSARPSRGRRPTSRRGS